MRAPQPRFDPSSTLGAASAPAARPSRRQLLQGAGAAWLVSQAFDRGLFARVWSQEASDEVIPFSDPVPDPPRPEMSALNGVDWGGLDRWITPNDSFFEVAHYDQPEIDAATYRLEIGGLVENPSSLTLAELRAQPRQEVTFTLECAGNNGFPWFVGGIGNARWAGAPLAPLLERAGVKAGGVEVVFFGRDAGEEEFARQTVPQNFGRSMSIDDARDPNLLLCYEMNGEDLPRAHGYPVRLIAPGWYGVANVKWLDRIEVWSTRYAGRFMARDYVTVREEPVAGGGSRFTQKVVGRTLLKSVPARVTRTASGYRLFGVAWGGGAERVEVKVDDGAWREATIDRGADQLHAWKFWHLDLGSLGSGEHSLTARAIAVDGSVQPTADDPVVAQRLTYWENNGQITRRIEI